MYTIQIHPKEWTFRKAAGTSRGVYHTRKVSYLCLTDSRQQGRCGWGECAPLPALSIDDVPNYAALLSHFCERLTERLNKGNEPLSLTNSEYEMLRPYPSMLFGIETMLLHYERNSWTLFDTPFARGEEGILINGLIWMGKYDDMLRQIDEKMRKGFRCVKLKIGAIDFEQELSLLRHIRKAYTSEEITLRVDANGAFTPEEALGKLERLSLLDLHSIEQPIRANQCEQMARLCQKTPLPIALDEELIGNFTIEAKQQLLRNIHPQYIILKPSLHGGMQGTAEWIAVAKSLDIGWWITSALETNIGLNAIAQLCATFGTTIPQGLGTGQLFTDNIPLPLEIRKDTLWYNTKQATPSVSL